MNANPRLALPALILTALPLAAADASMVFGVPITMTENATTATATFSMAHAAWSGMLYLDDGTAGYGQFLFNNKAARAGDVRSLGVFNAGAGVMFNYRVVLGAPGVFRMDNPADAPHFGLEQLDAKTVVLRIEDQPMSFSDRDWDDCVAVIRFSKAVTLGGPSGGDEEGVTPAPGTAAGLLLGVLGLGRRRRRA